jgi:glycosyltransferase involved in cell wall biosynthesis
MTLNKKLLIINGNQFGYSAGHYYYCKYLKDEFQIEYICYDRGYEKLLMDGISVHYVPFDRSKFQRTFQFIKNCILLSRKISPDILFVVYFDFCFLLAFFAKGKTKITDIRTGSLLTKSLKREWTNRYIKLQSLLFQRVIILSESLREHLKIKTKYTLVMPLGAEIYFSGLKDFSVFHLLYVGALDSRRIYDTVKGLAIFLGSNPGSAKGIKYTIVGFGTESELSKLHSAIEKYNLQNIVCFEGRKNYNELTVFFEKANIGIAYVPLEEYYQRQPVTKVFEYGLSGLFNIATETYENQLVINQVNGVLCGDNPASFAESLELVYHRRNTLNSAEIRSTFKNYEWKNLIKTKLMPFLNES